MKLLTTIFRWILNKVTLILNAQIYLPILSDIGVKRGRHLRMLLKKQ